MAKLARQLSEMKHGDHACLIYDSLQQQMAVMLPFVQEGLKRNEACLYIANDRSLTEIKALFKDYGIDVEGEIERGALIFPESNMRSGTFEPVEMVAVLRSYISDAIRKGFS